MGVLTQKAYVYGDISADMFHDSPEARGMFVHSLCRKVALYLVNHGYIPLTRPVVRWEKPDFNSSDWGAQWRASQQLLRCYVYQRGIAITPVHPEEWDAFSND